MSCWSLPLNKKSRRGLGTSPCLSVNFAELNSLQTTPSYSLCTKSINAHQIRDTNIPQTGPNNSKGNFHVAARATACYSTYPRGTAAFLHAWINKAYKTRLHLRDVRFRRASPAAESPLKSQIALYWSSLSSFTINWGQNPELSCQLHAVDERVLFSDTAFLKHLRLKT